jgi:hypothetical protein
METHILNGGAMTDRMEAAGFDNLIVCREALIDGPVNATHIDEFWKIRSAYLAEDMHAESEQYYEYVVTEFDKLKDIPAHSRINLWFGDDLFCQVNCWFIVSYLDQLGLAGSLYRVFPLIKNQQERWNDYGGLSAHDFRKCYELRVPFTADDVLLAKNLWKAYSTNDFDTLQSLASTPTEVFHDLEEVVQAHIERFPHAGELSRPERTLKEIMNSGLTDFRHIFPAFNHREGIYGFGDTQVRNILANLK